MTQRKCAAVVSVAWLGRRSGLHTESWSAAVWRQKR